MITDLCSTVVYEFDCEVADPGSYPWAGSFNVLMFKVILNAYYTTTIDIMYI